MVETTAVTDASLHGKNTDVDTTEDGDQKQMTQGINLSKKICFGIGGMPYQMTSTAKGLFLQIFLLDVVQMEAFYASLILFLGRAWDAITDPLVGYMITRSGRTRFGKLIPWIAFSMPMGILAYIMMWFTPQQSMTPSFSFFWFFIWTCLFDAFMTCYHVPYSSLTMFLGGNQKDRDSATAYRMGMELFATLAGATIQGQIVGVYHTKSAQACSQLNHSENSTSSLTDTLYNTRKAYTFVALALGLCYFLCCVVLVLGVKEQLAPLSTLDRIRMSYLAGMMMVGGHIPYVKLVLGFLFTSLAFQMAQGNFALFCTHAAGLGPYFQHLILIVLISATLSTPIWQYVLERLGKKTTFFIGISIYAPALGMVAFTTGNLPVFIISSILSGFSLSALYLLPWSMLPDVVDDFKVKNPTSKDLEPLFYSCYVFFNKFGGGLALGISTLALHFAGYVPGACSHNPAVIIVLRILFAPVPIVLLLIGLMFICLYPITKERCILIQKELRNAEKEKISQVMDSHTKPI
ncbi:hypothetical protein DPEC_G00008040 [Dallia pectoralis]|uniref:Uncharacterized protein n=1 Tax=Dallia pectoralis TaxID=75939 RepID=A0ACC2HL92_DALPE|nr:hypothetical protein DPEC_G00008040 [Dallia pectoralis]